MVSDVRNNSQQNSTSTCALAVWLSSRLPPDWKASQPRSGMSSSGRDGGMSDVVGAKDMSVPTCIPTERCSGIGNQSEKNMALDGLKKVRNVYHMPIRCAE